MRELPEGWAVCKMPEAVFFQEGPGLRKYQYTESGIPFLNIRTIFNGRIHIDLCQFLSKNEVDEKYQHFLLNAGDIICSTSGTLGKTAIVQSQDLPLLLNTSVMRFRSLDEKTVIQGYIHLYLKSDLFLSQAKKASTGSAQVNVGPSHLKEFEFPLPPLNEQKRIADRLDQLLTRIDKTKAQLDRILPLLKRFRQSVLAAATSGKLTEEWREENFQTHGAFKLLPLNQVVQEPMRNGRSVRDGNGIPVLRLSALKNGRIDWSYVKNGEWDGIDVNRFLVKEQDFLISRGNGSKDLVGRGALVLNVKLEIAFPDTMIRIRPNISQIQSRYLQIVWDTQNIRHQIESSAKTSAGIWKISQNDLEKIIIPTPPIEEQQEIVRRVEALFAKADRIEAQYKNARQQVDRLTPALLAKAFRGELVPQDPNDEPASVLLGRVKEARSIGQVKTVQRTKKKIKF